MLHIFTQSCLEVGIFVTAIGHVSNKLQTILLKVRDENLTSSLIFIFATAKFISDT